MSTDQSVEIAETPSAEAKDATTRSRFQEISRLQREVANLVEEQVLVAVKRRDWKLVAQLLRARETFEFHILGITDPMTARHSQPPGTSSL